MTFENIQCLVYDFDGVMTNNCVYVFEDGREAVQVNRSDGLAISYLKDHYHQLILSTETNPVVTKRAQKLGIPVLQGQSNKKHALQEYCEHQGFPLSAVLYVGNDLNDLDVMMSVGRSCCPSDAVEEIKKRASFCLQSKGGEGVIRELYDHLKIKELNP